LGKHHFIKVGSLCGFFVLSLPCSIFMGKGRQEAAITIGAGFLPFFVRQLTDRHTFPG
jgi:hypothetical protein